MTSREGGAWQGLRGRATRRASKRTDAVQGDERIVVFRLMGGFLMSICVSFTDKQIKNKSLKKKQ